MRIGKFTNEQLNKIVLGRLKNKRSEVILRPGIGEDCAAVKIGDEVCIMSTDPITGAINDIGKLSIHVSVNDIASSGAEPIAALVTILVPPNARMDDIERAVQDMIKTAERLNMDIVGGHTEVTDAVNRIVISTTVIGKLHDNELVTSAGAKPGDQLLMTKYAALEGTSIIASDFEKSLRGVLTAEEIANAKKLNADLSVLKEGMAAAAFGVSAMHDITEGGVYGAVHEMCTASKCGADIMISSIPVLEVTRKICAHFNISAFELISSGSMLITVADGEGLQSHLRRTGISSAMIGRITPGGIYAMDGRVKTAIPAPESDALFRITGRIQP